MTHRRHNKKWSNSELEKLYREYNLRELSIDQISELHGRSVYSILHKLQKEHLIDNNWSNANGWSNANEKSIVKEYGNLQTDVSYEYQKDEEASDDQEEEEEEEDQMKQSDEEEDQVKQTDDQEEESEEENQMKQEEESDDQEDQVEDRVKEEEEDLYNMEAIAVEKSVKLFWKFVAFCIERFSWFYINNIMPLFKK
jgi:cobalamin biosynthesis protein CobT